MFTKVVFRVNSDKLFLTEKSKDISLVFDDKHFFLGLNVGLQTQVIPGNLMFYQTKKGKIMFTRNEKDVTKFGKNDSVIDRFMIVAQDELSEYELLKSLGIEKLNDLKQVLKYILKGAENVSEQQNESNMMNVVDLQKKTNELTASLISHLADAEKNLNELEVYFPPNKKGRKVLRQAVAIEVKLLKGLQSNFKKNDNDLSKYYTLDENKNDKFHLDSMVAEIIYDLFPEERRKLNQILNQYKIAFAIEHKAVVGPAYYSLITDGFNWLSKINFDEMFEKMVVAYRNIYAKLKKEWNNEAVIKLDTLAFADYAVHTIIKKINAAKSEIDQLVICQSNFLAALLKERQMPNNKVKQIISDDSYKQFVEYILNKINERIPLS